MSATNPFPKWIPVAQELPPDGEIVLTKRGERNRNHHARFLVRRGAEWFHVVPPHTPTHWARD